jgi:serine/threonine protein kinase
VKVHDKIGRYRVVRLLGSGGFASVWLGTDDTLDEPVAIKVLAENWAHVPDVRNRFLQEARLLRQADSDRVVRMYDVGELADGRPYFVMSYADRGTVADQMVEAPLSAPEVLRVVIETSRAVAVLHSLDIVHRDIKPSNVLLQTRPDGSTRTMISDLGVAKPLAQASGFTIAAGTPGYMAPEQAELGMDIDVRADVYGLGAFAYHLFTGTKYEGRHALRRSDLPKRLRDIVARALEPDRARRWPNAEAYAEALTGFLNADAQASAPKDKRPAADDTTTVPRRVTEGKAGVRKRVSRRHAVIGAGVLVLAVAAAMTIYLGQDNHREAGTASGTSTRSTGSPSDTPVSTSPSVPAHPPAISLEITFGVGADSGYVVSGSGIDGHRQWANLRPSAGPDAGAEVSVYTTGSYDPSEARRGERVEIGERSGFYLDALPDPDTGDDRESQTRKPAAVVQYAPDGWYVVQSDQPVAEARSSVPRIANAVTFDDVRQFRFPIRVGYLPQTLHPCGGLDGLDAGWTGSWNAWIDLCDDRPGTGIGDSETAVRFMMTPSEAQGGLPSTTTRINGLPVALEENGAFVDCGEFQLEIWVADSHVHRYDRSEQVKMIQAIVVRDFGDRDGWLPADQALPHI